MQINGWSGILVYLEMQDNGIADVSLELIGKAAELSGEGRKEIFAVGIGNHSPVLEKQLQDYPLDAVYLYQIAEEFQADIYEEAVIACIHKLKPAIVLFGGTMQGRALAPRVAVAFATGVTADCTQLLVDEDNQLVQIRPAFGGNIMASIVTEKSRPQIATVRPGIFSYLEPVNHKKIAIQEKRWESSKPRVTVLDKRVAVWETGIGQQELLVAAGRGVKKKEDLNMLRELAGLLGGKLASSRALVEKGWMEPEEQIGLSGITVAPRCMLTFGVSGTLQFMAGMKNTGNIIAVDTNPNANIFEIAHYPVCADLYEVIPKLIQLIKDVIAI